MSEVLVILCTFPNLDQARQIGTVLVETQLAACVNLLPAVESIYRWQGKVEIASEVLAVFKTSAAVFPAFQQKLVELHPYDVPEIIALDPCEISDAYRAWVCSEVGQP